MVPDTYEHEYITLRTKCGHYSVLSHLSGTSGTFETDKVGGFVKWHTTAPSNMLNQDNSQFAPEGHPPKSCTLDMAPARRRDTRVSKRGENWTATSHSQPKFQQQDQLIEPLLGIRFTSFYPQILGNTGTTPRTHNNSFSIRYPTRYDLVRSICLFTCPA